MQATLTQIKKAEIVNTSTIHAAWGYRPDGSAQIFDLGPGEALPDGRPPSPTVTTYPARATAEALSAMVARAAETPRPSAVASNSVPDASAKGAKLSLPSTPSDQVDLLRLRTPASAAERPPQDLR